ncbi:integrase core domain-containing protein [Sphingobacterium multivorum]|uniref:integrase core domain-containing protein n=1 Tax=Sphingobacterium multivorum TaxID=28454 RepID=UPI00351A0990
MLQRYGVAISMTQNGSPYDNALAERVNGILKNEFYPNGFTRIIKMLLRILTRSSGYITVNVRMQLGFPNAGRSAFS